MRAGCSTCRRSGSSARAAIACAASCANAACASSPSTRRTASASGGTISGPSTASSGGCATSSPASRCTRSPRPPPSGSAATSSRSSGCTSRSCSSARSIVRTSRTACCAAPTCGARFFASSPGMRTRRASSIACRVARWRRRPTGWPARGSARFRITRGWPTTCAPGTRRRFSTKSVDIVVATVAFGMGIDRSNVRFVIHAGAPRSPEHYQQESGRAGRDGLPAECVLIYSHGDFLRWRQMLEANGELTETARALLRDMERYACSTRCRHRSLVEYFGQPFEPQTCGACDWCLKELDSVAGCDDGRAEDSVVRRAGQGGLGRRPRGRRPARAHQRQDRLAASRPAVDVRPAPAGVAVGGARLHRTARGRRHALARRRAVSGAAPHGGQASRC